MIDHLPDAEHTRVRTKLRQGWANPDPDAAKDELEKLARTLQRQHPGAASSLREGLSETHAVTRARYHRGVAENGVLDKPRRVDDRDHP